MSDRTRDTRDIATGVLLAVLGVFAASYALARYRIGSPGSMGPGFFPMALGIGLAGLGAAIGVSGWRRARPAVQVAPKPRALLAVAAGVAVFALTIRPLGFVPAAFCLVTLAALADNANRPLRILVLAAGLTAASWAIFVVGLGLPLRAFNG